MPSLTSEIVGAPQQSPVATAPEEESRALTGEIIGPEQQLSPQAMGPPRPFVSSVLEQETADAAQRTGWLDSIAEDFGYGMQVFERGAFLAMLDAHEALSTASMVLTPWQPNQPMDPIFNDYFAGVRESMAQEEIGPMEELTSEIVRYGINYALLRKTVPVGGMVGGSLAGIITEAYTYDPFEPRLSNVVAEIWPETWIGGLSSYLAADDEDSYPEAYMKQLTEAAILGPGVDALGRRAGRILNGAWAMRRSMRSQAARNNMLSQMRDQLIPPASGADVTGMTTEQYSAALTTLDRRALTTSYELMAEAPGRLAVFGATPPPAEGMTRLYRNAGGYGDSLTAAQAFAGSSDSVVRYIDVETQSLSTLPKLVAPRERRRQVTANLQRMGNTYILPNQAGALEWRGAVAPDGRPWGSVRAEAMAGEYRSRLEALGQFDPEDMNRKVAWFARMVRETAREGDPEAAASILEGIQGQRVALEAMQDLEVGQRAGVLSILRRNTIDRRGTIRTLLEGQGDQGRVAMMYADLATGANTRAVHEWNAWAGQIWNLGDPNRWYSRWNRPLSREDTTHLTDMILMERQIRATSTPDGYLGPNMDERVLENANRARDDMVIRIGQDKYMELMPRVNAFFDAERAQFEKLRDGGFISQETFEMLASGNYARSTDALNAIDPIVGEITRGNTTVRVTASGIEQVRSSSGIDPILQDPKLWLGQVIMRTTNAVMRNRANTEMLEMAARNPENGFVRLDAPPQGEETLWARVNTFKDGTSTPMWIRSNLANEWIYDPVTALDMWRLPVGMVSGTIPVKAMATGVNPTYGLRGFVRDLSTMWLQPNLYSPIPPVSVWQMGGDFRAVASDAFHRTGRFEEYINEGGGLSFLTHQGRPVESPARSVLGGRSVPTVLENVMHTGGWFNESMEIFVRLAIRERALHNRLAELGQTVATQGDNDYATAIARGYIDYNQGTLATKSIDMFYPYFNANVQGLRAVFRGAVVNPQEYAIKMGQMAGFYGAWALGQRTVNPEAYDGIDYGIRARNLVQTTPLYRINERGEREYMYFKIPTDPSIAFLNGMVQAGVDYSMSGEMPSGRRLAMLETMRASFLQSLGIIDPSQALPPTIGAIMAMNGVDPYTFREIWGGPAEVAPGEQYTDETGMMARDIGALSGLSPMEIETALQELLPRNAYTDLAGAFYKEVTEGMRPEDVDAMTRTMADQMAAFPGMSSVIGFTSTTSNVERLVAEERREGQATVEYVLQRELDQMLEPMLGVPDPAQRAEAITRSRQWLRSKARTNPLEYPALSERYDNVIGLYEMRRRLRIDQLESGPSWSDILQGSREDPVVRAETFRDWWVDAVNRDDRDTMRVLRQMLQGEMRGYSLRQGSEVFYRSMGDMRRELRDRGMRPTQLWEQPRR